MNAASLNIAELYVAAFQQLARTNNTLILPANCNDVPQMVATAMTMYKTLAKNEKDLRTIQKNENSGDSENVSNLSEYYSDDDEKPK